MIVYVGNIISRHGKTATTIETLGKLLETEGFNIVATSAKKNKGLRLFDMLHTVFKNRKKVHYVLIDTYSTSNFYYTYLVAKLCTFLKIKYIPILHGGNLEKRLKNNPKKSQTIFNNAHINIAPSLFLKEIFNRYGYTNVNHIPNNIALSEYPYKKRTQVSAKLLWVRSFAAIYNPEMAIKVAATLRKKGMKVDLCMIGPEKDGSLARTKALAETLNVEVEFTGKLTKNEWLKRSKFYDIFINTTNFDNTPVSVIEAMALGLPIVSTNVGGIPFLIKDTVNGMLVNPNDITAMTDAIEKLTNNPELAVKLSENARSNATSFDWEIVKKQWNTLLS